MESSSKFNEDENEDDDENSEENSFTTLRKSSAFALQQFSKNYSELVFVKMQGYLQTMLQSSNEDHQEAAVLALGAISDQDGSYCAIEVHLEQLVPFLINKLDGSREDVRATTCWTLSKFSEWIGNNDSDQNQQIFLLYHSKLIQKMADPDENVQEAACNAYSQLVEVVPEKCQPHLLELLNVLNSAVDNYQDGPLIAMFDCVGSIAQAVGDGLNNPQIIATLLPLLSKKWEQFDDSNRSLLTLFECFESVISAIKEAIEPYAKNIFDRCIKILKNVLNTIKSDDFENIYEETDFYIRSMDLIAQIIQALNEKAEPIVMQSELILILREYLNLRDLLMKQYVFSMVGDLQKHLGACIKDKLPEFIHCACLSLYYNEQIIDPTQNQHQLTVCNNACWCLGEMAVSEVNRDVIKPFTDEIVRKLLGIYQSQRINKSLAQNISITLGRLGLINPEAVALHLDKIAKQWCVSLRYVKGDNDDEKYQAYKGLCYTIARNTAAIKKDFPYFCSAIVHYHDPRPELHQIFKGILHVFKQHCGEEYWNGYIRTFPDDLQQKLKHKFDL